MMIIDKIIKAPQEYPKFLIGAKHLTCLIPVVVLGTINYPWTNPLLWIQNARQWMTDHWYFVPVILAFPVLLNFVVDIWDHWAKIFMDAERDAIPQKQMLAVLTGLGSIVGMKCDRFGKFKSNLTKCPKKACDIFFEITQPKVQIEEIVKQIYYSMRVMLADEEIKVILVRVENRFPAEWITYLPSLEKPPDALLNRRDTFLSEVIEKGQITFINDIAKEIKRGGKKKKRFLVIEGDSALGSIVGIPIRNRHFGSDIRYVLTIKSERPDIFNAKFEGRFGKIIKEFTNRIVVEDNLLEIKSFAKSCHPAA